MRVDIVVEPLDLPWIAGRFARELVARLPQHGIEATINAGGGDLQYQQIVYGPPSRRPAVGMFTHDYVRPVLFGPLYDGQIALNPESHRYLVGAVGPDRPTLIEMPVADIYIRPVQDIVFGVCGSTKADGRKGEHLVARMVAAGYTVRAWGRGWPCEIVSTQLEDLPAFYRSLDFYVETSSDEGHCVPALEAMAMGVPVISHTHGTTRPVLAYEKSNWNSLSRVLHALTHPRTYDDWAREHAAYFKKVLGG